MDMYVVKYKELLENYECGPLTETVFNNEVRPVPPHDQIRATGFAYLEKVDALDNDGWWMGKITRKEGSNYKVDFETTGDDEIACPLSCLRFHLDWRHGNTRTLKSDPSLFHTSKLSLSLIYSTYVANGL
ncbi:hypothetical protein FNV43_RR13711 [Rhamnella rubrinervis]|uniref:Agenet domain-containing protein n=1 Tax=Rhamnella rubrinervis TaxID=2594499 RepID=A0A8K0MFH7_9ROSA|nr:hypothetical protein FNV43_RR13711 [Rhamnella rubrinervis]